MALIFCTALNISTQLALFDPPVCLWPLSKPAAAAFPLPFSLCGQNIQIFKFFAQIQTGIFEQN